MAARSAEASTPLPGPARTPSTATPSSTTATTISAPPIPSTSSPSPTPPPASSRTATSSPRTSAISTAVPLTAHSSTTRLFFFYAFDQQKRNFPIVAVPTPQFLAAGNAAYNNCKNVTGGAAVDAITCAESRGVTAAQVNAALGYIGGQSGIVPSPGRSDHQLRQTGLQAQRPQQCFVDLQPHALGLPQWHPDQPGHPPRAHLGRQRLRQGRLDRRQDRHDPQPAYIERTPCRVRTRL